MSFALVVLGLTSASAQLNAQLGSPGQSQIPPSFQFQEDWESGPFDGIQSYGSDDGVSLAPERAEEFLIVSQTLFEEPGANWIRLHLSEVELGSASFLRVISLKDGSQQDLDSSTLALWYNYSAFFEGDAVLVELHVAPRDRGVRVKVGQLLAGNPSYTAQAPQTTSFTLCASDNRVASTEPRVGRVRRTDGAVFCTAWLASNGAALMAGHCFDFDNNGTNELITAGSIIEFNPPASSANGATNPSTAANQYPIDMNQLNWSPSPYAIGSDWGVFGLSPNTGNGARPHNARGFFRMTRETPPVNASIRITGCGNDITPAGTGGSGANAQTQTVQTSTGPFVSETSIGTRFFHRYATDTTGNNSGSPIIWDTNGVTIGIHTNAGCTAAGGSNQGVSFEHTALEFALRDFVSAQAIFVDRDMPDLMPTPNGTVFRPFLTFEEGAAQVPSGGVLSITPGLYSPASGGSFFLSTPMTVQAPVGAASISG